MGFEAVEGAAGDGVEAGDAVDGDAPGAPDDPGRHQSGPQPGEGGRPGGGDHGVQRALGHLGRRQGLREHLAQGLGVTAGIGLLVLAQHLQSE